LIHSPPAARDHNRITIFEEMKRQMKRQMRKQMFLITLVLALSAANVLSANAQVIHVAAAGASSQFNSNALGADYLALLPTSSGGAGAAPPTNSTSLDSQNCNGLGNPLASYHYSAKNAAVLVDNRSSNIVPITNNLWVVWTAACSDATGATGVTDIWLTFSVDSTTAVRALYAQEPDSRSGAQIGVVTPPPSAGNLIGSVAGLWADNALDVAALPANVYNVIGTGITNATVTGDVHVNVAFTDIRAEDALFVTTRVLNNYTATLSGLGYRLISGNTNYGVSIESGQQGSSGAAAAASFALSGGTDPITGETVPATVVTPIGAGPIIFAYNNNGAGAGHYPTNLVSGVVGNGTAGTSFPLANLFGGGNGGLLTGTPIACDTNHPAFGGTGPATALNVNPILREPLGGTTAVVEYSVFRTTGNTSDSQELGVSRSTASGGNLNPLNSSNGSCAGGGGYRSRAVSTSEEIGQIKSGANQGILGIPYGLGYFFWTFSNSNKFSGASSPANYNYLTIDGVDPLGGIGGANQTFPAVCPTAPATNCQASLWPHNVSFPTLRNGTYPVWSVLRWISYASNTDSLGPVGLAAATQNAVDTYVADFVPFHTASGGVGGVSDGLSVYHSHFKVTVPKGSCGATCTSVTGSNVTATSSNSTNGGNTLGLSDAGGDVGGAIEGPYGIDVPFVGTVNTTATHTVNKGYKVTHTGTAGPSDEDFVASAAWEGLTITINGQPYTIANVLPTKTVLYVTTSPGTQTGVDYSITAPAALAATPGVLSKKR
jgi:hypothetical protein